MEISKHVLPNKLRIITVPIPSMESVTTTIWVNVGSRYETPLNSGISHFLEHMPAKGTTKWPSPKLFSEAIDSFGGEFNAGTSKEWTNYYIKSRKAKFDTAFEILSDMVLSPLLRQEDIDNEKGVIIEELGMYEDTPIMHIGDIFDRLIFAGNPLGRDIIGTRETIKSMKRSDFVNYRKKYYGGNTILVTVSGGVTVAHAQKLAKKYLGDLSVVDEPEFKSFAVKQKKPQVLISYKKNEQAHLIMGFHSNKRGCKDRFSEAILTTILGGGMSSRLFTEVREKRGLAYSVRSGMDRYDDTGYLEAYAGVDPKRVDEAVKVMLDQHYGLANGDYEIEDSELAKAKEYMKGHIALGLEDTKAINGFVGIRELKLGKVETPDQVYAEIDGVSKEDIVRVAKKLFVPEHLNLALIGPYRDEGRFRDLLLR